MSGAASALTFGSGNTADTAQKELFDSSSANATEEMIKRWIKIIKGRVPTVDLVDISAEVLPVNNHKRQFAPEYSQLAYEQCLIDQEAIGDYTAVPRCPSQLNDYAR